MEGNWKYSLICSPGQASILLIEFVTYLWKGNVSSSSVVLCVTAILGDNSGPQVEYTEAHKVLLWSLFSKVHLMSKCLETDRNDVS